MGYSSNVKLHVHLIEPMRLDCLTCVVRSIAQLKTPKLFRPQSSLHLRLIRSHASTCYQASATLLPQGFLPLLAPCRPANSLRKHALRNLSPPLQHEWLSAISPTYAVKMKLFPLSILVAQPNSLPEGPISHPLQLNSFLLVFRLPNPLCLHFAY